MYSSVPTRVHPTHPHTFAAACNRSEAFYKHEPVTSTAAKHACGHAGVSEVDEREGEASLHGGAQADSHHQ